MPRLTRRVFRDLAIYMVSLGLAAGLGFPLFVMPLGVPARTALTWSFVGATILAGLLVGGLNFWLTHTVLRGRLWLLITRLRLVNDIIREATLDGDWSGCDPASCAIPVDSEDELGESAAAFNHLIEALARSHEVENALTSFSEVLAGHLEADSLAKHGLARLVEHTGAAAGAVCVDRGGELQVVANLGLRGTEGLADSEIVRQAMGSEGIVRISTPADLAIDAALIEFRPKWISLLPVRFKEESLGVVVLAGSTELPSEAERLMDAFGRGFAVSLNNALLHEREQRLAALDALTGLYNRRFGLDRLREELARATRSGTPLGVLMLDLDHFKSVNDTYGHLAGDRLLRAVARTASDSLREGDVLCRYGGEEFLAILPGAEAATLHEIGERIRR